MEYNVAYDILTAGCPYWWFPLPGFLFIAIGIAMLRFPNVFRPTTPRGFLKGMGFFMIIFSCLWILGASKLTFGDYLSLKTAMRKHRAKVIEGVVTNFVPTAYGGASEESFTVNGHTFSYFDSPFAAGFNKTKSHGGPIDNGITVRVWYVGGRIARLEVQRK